MKGKILGLGMDDGSGVITAEDGGRHKFSGADWRGERPPSVGMTVDFESDNGLAKDIYPVAGSMGAFGKVDLGGLSANAAAGLSTGRIVEMFTRSLAAPLAVLGLIACLLPAISSPAQDYSLIDLSKALDSVALPSGPMAAMLGVAQQSDLGTIKTLVILRFAAPLAALWLIWATWTGRPEKMPLLIAGGSLLLGAALIFMTRSAVLDAVPDMMRPQIESVISVGMGAWLLALTGCAAVAAGRGLIRNPLAKA